MAEPRPERAEPKRAKPVSTPPHASLQSLPGVGPKVAGALADAGFRDVRDLAFLLPRSWDDLRAPLSPREVSTPVPGAALARVAVRGTVKSARQVFLGRRRAVQVVVEGDGAKVTAWWFFFANGILAKATLGSDVLLAGRFRTDAKGTKVAHPDMWMAAEAPRVLARYTRIGAATESALREMIGVALERGELDDDAVPPTIREENGWPTQGAALRALHGERGRLSAPPDERVLRGARERFAWLEAACRVFDRKVAESATLGHAAVALPLAAHVRERLRAELGFSLTKDQARAIADVEKDLDGTAPMKRLLLGDVGTGKTAVALFAAASAVANGMQVAILVPTTTLADQYLDAAAPLARATGARIAALTGSTKDRSRLLDALATGKLDVAVGTHALLQEGVVFASLGLVVVDEQHRLGVAQRLSLVTKGRGAKGTRPHVLSLSATPIPRTLSLALRGDLSTSTLEARPKGRPPVVTQMIPRGEVATIFAALDAACRGGGQAFVVLPRVEDGIAEDGQSDPEKRGVLERKAALEQALPGLRVGVLHGRTDADERRGTMHAFRSGALDILVATTVIEVGVDVPNASLMVIHEAERFGIAQLHQLRGRVGRGARPGTCLLVHGDVGGLAEERLRAVARESSGYVLARLDLALRGGGDAWGTRQHGESDEFVYLDPWDKPPWLQSAEAYAAGLFSDDPALSSSTHAAFARARARLAHRVTASGDAG